MGTPRQVKDMQPKGTQSMHNIVLFLGKAALPIKARDLFLLIIYPNAKRTIFNEEVHKATKIRFDTSQENHNNIRGEASGFKKFL